MVNGWSMWWKLIRQNFIEQRKKLMILFRNNLLQGSFLKIHCFDSCINIVERCLKHLELPFLNCSKEQRSSKHNNTSSEWLLGAYLWFKYPLLLSILWFRRLLRHPLYCNRCIMAVCRTILRSKSDSIGCKSYCNIMQS